jgi:hypothetical protein
VKTSVVLATWWDRATSPEPAAQMVRSLLLLAFLRVSWSMSHFGHVAVWKLVVECVLVVFIATLAVAQYAAAFRRPRGQGNNKI